MKIIVCIKQVPDSAAKVIIQDRHVSWGDAPLILNPWDEYAVEAALRQKEAHGGDVTAISIGSASAKEALKQALAMGADQAILISDPALSAIDTQGAARVLAAAIRKIDRVDMAFFGRQAIDSDSGLTAAQTARVLGWPMFGLSAVIQVDDGVVKVERSTEEGRQIVSGRLPGIFSVGKDFGEPRYPAFIGIRKAARAEIPVWSLADLGIDAPVAFISPLESMQAPVRDVTCEIIDGSSPAEIAQKLADKILAENVL